MQLFGKTLSFRFNLLKDIYIIFLLFVVLLSYGQILGMHVWQDDNALFFKLAHIEERAGYLGAGPFGDGAYKYIATPYIPIYRLFGLNTLPYFAFNLILYFLTTVYIYKVFSQILGKRTGKVIGFLYAAGFIASDGIIRIFNSVITSLSVVLITTILFCYWKFYKTRNTKWYFLVLISFYLVTELARGRSHYLISVLIMFELLFLAFKKFPRSFLTSVFRISPFIYVFYQYYVLNADHRSGEVKKFVTGLFHGEIHKTYSLLTSFANVLIPDWLTGLLFDLQSLLRGLLGTNFQFFSWGVITASCLLIFLLLRKHTYKAILIPLFFSIALIWKVLVNDLFSSTVLNLGEQQLSNVFLGGVLVLIMVSILLSLKKNRALYLFLISWVVLNIAAYAAYNPTVSYESVNRYLAHSFLAWVIALGILYKAVEKSTWRTVVQSLIILVGIGNLSASLFYQHQILKHRSNPPKKFYEQLKIYVPTVNKGDVFYFDVAADSQRYFADAFSVASMPETTAIAWRYGVDRYDIKRFTKYEELLAEASTQSIQPGKLHTFRYSNSTLTNTSNDFRRVFFNQNSTTDIQAGYPLIGRTELVETDDATYATSPNLTIDLKKPFLSLVSNEVELTLRLTPLTADIKFPYLGGRDKTYLPKVFNESTFSSKAIQYGKNKEQFIKNSKYRVSSQWQDRVVDNSHDGDSGTVWQADRVVWNGKKDAFIEIDLTKPTSITGVVWINGFSNHTPTKYAIEVSNDQDKWAVVKDMAVNHRLENNELRVDRFDKVLTKYTRLRFYSTLNNDSPAIAEFWTLGEESLDLEIPLAEKYLSEPFAYIKTKEDFFLVTQLLQNKGKIQLSWKTDNTEKWQTNKQNNLEVVFDGEAHTYKTMIPAGGSKVSALSIGEATFPGSIEILRIRTHPLSVKDIEKVSNED